MAKGGSRGSALREATRGRIFREHLARQVWQNVLFRKHQNGSPGRGLSAVAAELPICSIVRRWLGLPMSTCSKRDYPHEPAEHGAPGLCGLQAEGRFRTPPLSRRAKCRKVKTLRQTQRQVWPKLAGMLRQNERGLKA